MLEAIYLVWFSVLIAACYYLETGKTKIGIGLMVLTIAAPVAILVGVPQ